jgi:hypothetical protein
LGSLGSAKTESNFPYIQALMEHGGQIDLGYPGMCAATAFGAKGMIALVRMIPDRSVDFHLGRLDRAIAIAQATRISVDEIYGFSPVALKGRTDDDMVPGLLIPNVMGIVRRGSIAFGVVKEAAAVAAIGPRIVAILAPIPYESVEALLLRLDRAIALAHSTGIPIDEVFDPSENAIH